MSLVFKLEYFRNTGSLLLQPFPWIFALPGHQQPWYWIWWINESLYLTHWGQVMHIFVSKVTIIVSDNGSAPGRRQAIIWTNAGILLIWPLGTNFSEISIDVHTFSFQKIHFKMLSGKWRPFCLSFNVLTAWWRVEGSCYGLHMPMIKFT